jgi:hypothetical protein
MAAATSVDTAPLVSVQLAFDSPAPPIHVVATTEKTDCACSGMVSGWVMGLCAAASVTFAVLAKKELIDQKIGIIASCVFGAGALIICYKTCSCNSSGVSLTGTSSKQLARTAARAENLENN